MTWLVLSKELDRASRRAAKTIDAASAAVSVTSAAVEAGREKAGKAVEKMNVGDEATN